MLSRQIAQKLRGYETPFYLYDMAFATHDFGKAAAISIILFVLIFGLIMLIRKKVLVVEED